MSQDMSPIKLIVEGPMALFTMPEFNIERFTYDILTPSAAVNILKSIYWKPSFEYVVDKIAIYNPIEYITIKTNEMQNKIDVYTEVKNCGKATPIAISRTQRNNIYLRDVKYLICAHIEMTGIASERGEETRQKETGIFYRKVKSGQCFRHPFLGTRECSVSVFREYDEHTDSTPLRLTKPLGIMLHHIDYKENGEKVPIFFNAVIENGVLNTNIKGGTQSVFAIVN